MITFASSNKKKNNMDEKSKIPTPVISLIPLFVLVALLAMVIPIFSGDALLGGSQVSLLIASSVCVGIAMIKYNYKWSSLEEGMAKHKESDTGHHHLTTHRSHFRHMDAQWHSSHAHILRVTHAHTPDILGILLSHLRHRFRHYRELLDNHRHHRRRLARDRKGTRIRSWVDCRRYHFGGLFR